MGGLLPVLTPLTLLENLRDEADQGVSTSLVPLSGKSITDFERTTD